MANMKARELYGYKQTRADGTIVEMVIRQLPQGGAQQSHRLKYRLFYGRKGERIVGYDNERGKGDHRHIRGLEMPYRFVSVERLIEDFKVDVRNAGGSI